MDFNHDGKHDGRDYIEYKMATSSDNDSSSYSGGGSGCLSISSIVCIAYLSVLLKADIPVNFFTLIIGVVCAVVLIGRVFG